jgi:glucoamylase
MSDPIRFAPGWPGIEPRWTSSAKSAVGTAIGQGSRVWFTASHGILNEIYYPEVDTACLRDLGFLVTAAGGYFNEEKRDCLHSVEWIAAGIPAFRMINSCPGGRFAIEKHLCTSPDYDVVLQRVRFTPRIGTLADFTLTLLTSPHLGNHGAGNTGWVGTHKGERLLFAQREYLSLAVACSAGFGTATAGFAGNDDAWNDVHQNGRITHAFDRAENGNIALAAEIDLAACGGEFTIAIGLGADPDTAGLHARAALLEAYDDAEGRFADGWRDWQKKLLPLDEPIGASTPHLYRASTAVMKTHMSLNSDGGAIASLSVPWGNTRGDGDLGGYHLVWPRDMVATASGLLAAGAYEEMMAMLRFLAVTQERDGHWPQNMWLNGKPFWTGLQLDETAFPILLVDLAHREGALTAMQAERWWPMVERAALWVAMHGPATGQDRWEEDAGYAPFSLAVAIAALVTAADLADLAGEPARATYLRETADDWNAGIEHWTYVEDTPLARRVGVSGYYVRIGSAAVGDAAVPAKGTIELRNRDAAHATARADELVSVDALALVRFGLRDANDPRIVNTVRVIDAVLRTETKSGPTWKRYNEDGYGEHEDGRAFDGTGIGRGWPLLAGERAHYELSAGNTNEAMRLAAVLRAQANEGALIPEQVWDAADIPAFELVNGGPTGSAMPLVWAHAEYVKLLRSLRDGRVFATPPQTRARYVHGEFAPRIATWRLDWPRGEFPVGRMLRVDLAAKALVRWTADEWVTQADLQTVEIGPGVHSVELPTSKFAIGTALTFTIYWPDGDRWQGGDFRVSVVAWN